MGDSITISISGDINMSTDGDADLFSLDDQHRSDSDWDSQSLTESDIDAELELQDQDEVNIFTILEAFEGPAQNHDGHGSPGNDEVEDSDDQQTSEDEDSEGQEEEDEDSEGQDEDSEGQDEDSEGQEEEDEEINVEDDGEGNAQPSSVTMPAEPRSPPSPPQPQAASPAHHLHPATLRHVGESEFMTSGHSQHAAPSSSSPSRHTNSSPAAGSSVWQYEPSPGPSSLSHTHNSSMDDFQVPLMGGLSVLSSLAAARSSQSLTENFQPCKRRRIMSPVKASDLIDRKSSPQGTAAVQNDEDDDDGNRCSICFELWDNSGRHRLASLKCGHLFGLGCIEKWLKGQGGKCPSCNEKAKVKDIRVIYAKAIKMVDTTERDRALDELGREREMRRQVELEAAQARLQCQQYTEESGRLRALVAMLREQLATSRSRSGDWGSALSHMLPLHLSLQLASLYTFP